MTSFRYLAAPAFLALALGAHAAKWDEMDYGRFLTATYTDADGKTSLDKKPGCATDKGIAIKLGNDEGALLFDTDLCRFSGGWTGGFVKTKGVAFDGGHGPNPGPPEKATMYFQVNRGPGWSKGNDFKDPRALPTGPGAADIPFGPLPADWAKYKGLFLSGDHVVVAYTVGEGAVLEMPGMEKVDDTTVLTRSMTITKPGAGASVVLADSQTDAPAKIENGVGVLEDGDKRTVVGVIGAPVASELKAQDGRVYLTLASLDPRTVFKVVYAEGGAGDLAMLTEAVKKATPGENLVGMVHGGPAHWPETVVTKGELGKDDAAYTLDTIGVPTDNPYKSWIRIGGFDFFKDGRVAISTWSGDVWIGTGIDDKLENITWKRFATGLFQPLGLKIVDDTIHVLGRDQITRLHDINGNGEADWYENFNSDVQVTPGFHEFALDLQTDPAGNFYFAKGGPVNPGGRGWGPLSDHNGCIFKVSKDGKTLEVFATGVRAPNGMGVGPDGQVSVGDNQGTWVPVDYIHFPKKGEFIGVTDLAHHGDDVPTDYPPHLCWIPYDMDNSCGSHVWVTSDKWGPLQGNMLYLSYGKCALFNVLKEDVDGTVQGGVVKFPFKFDTGAMRARFNPVDGQLYVGGLKGWQTDGSKDAAFQRVRYTGKTPTLQNELRVTDKGIHIGFTAPIDPATAGDVGNYAIDQWNYRWTKDYGSAEYRVSDPKRKGHDSVEIKSVKVAPDNKSVFLEVPGLEPVMQMKITMNIKAADGSDVPRDVAHTINKVGKE